MKRTCVFLLSVAVIASVNAQTDTSTSLFTEFSDSTGFGTADGKLTSKEIGPPGGTIVSEDGRVELIFPAGALTQNTNISIQPTTNLAPNGVGKSYWFEPSGIQFKKPVQIIFHYTDEEAEICPPDWMSLGIQNKNGKWSFVDYESFDSVSKKLRGYINHFSGATNIHDIRLIPDKLEILVDGKTFLDLIDITRPDTAYPGGYAAGLLDQNNPVLWYANEVLHGNTITGTIKEQTAPLGRQKVTVAEYRAPSIMPLKNPVKIWAEVYRKTRKGKALRKRLTANITVYDAYQISLTHEFTSRGGLNSEMKDMASCVVWVYYRIAIEITDIKNYPPTVIKNGRNGPFRETIYTDGALGTIHLTESYSKVNITKDHPPEVYFEPAVFTVLTYKFRHCARGACTEIETISDKTITEEINFIANGKEQRYSIYTGAGDSYKLVVTPHRIERSKSLK